MPFCGVFLGRLTYGRNQVVTGGQIVRFDQRPDIIRVNHVIWGFWTLLYSRRHVIPGVTFSVDFSVNSQSIFMGCYASFMARTSNISCNLNFEYEICVFQKLAIGNFVKFCDKNEFNQRAYKHYTLYV